MLRLKAPPADILAYLLTEAGITGWQREYVIIPGRRWRGDFVWEAPRSMADGLGKLLVEVDGGLFARAGAQKCRFCGQIPAGRHSTGVGRTKDVEKLNEAMLAGYRVLVVTPDQIQDGQALQWIQRALQGGTV